MKKILTLTDFSKKAKHAAELALRIARKTHSGLLIYHAFQIPELIPAVKNSDSDREDYTLIKEENEKKLKEFTKSLLDKTSGEPNVPEISYLCESGTIGDNIDKVLYKKRNIWMIVMGDKSKRDDVFSHFIFGSDTYEVINATHCPVLLVPEKAEVRSVKTIAFATDLNKSDYKALSVLADFARFFRAKIIVTHISTEKLSVEERVNHQDLFDKICSKVDYSDITYEDIRGEGISVALNTFSRSAKIDILAMAHKKHPFWEHILHSSTTEDMLSYHKIPLLILPADH